MSKSYVKLKNVGDSATFVVTRCAPGTGKYPDVEFEDDKGNVYPVPKSAADRQLERLGLAEDGIVGRIITISRSENRQDASKPYWNIEANGAAKAMGGPSNGGTAGTTQPPATAQAATPATPEGEKVTAKYLRAVQYVVRYIVPELKNAGVAVTHEGVSAMAATVFIAANGKH